MPRVKRGVTKRQRHKKVLEATRGQRGARSARYRAARESMLKGLSHAYRHRRERKRDFRGLWIMRINAAARQQGLSYSQFMDGLRRASVGVDRKALADLAVRDENAFSSIAAVARQASGR